MEKFMLGALPSKEDVRDYTAKVVPRVLPEEYFIPDNVAAYNQKYGTCVAQAIRRGWQRRYGVEFGTNYLYGGGRTHTMSGMYPNEAANFAVTYGLAPMADDPTEYEVQYVINYYQAFKSKLTKAASPYKGGSWARLYTVDEIKAAICDNLHVVFCSPITGYFPDKYGWFSNKGTELLGYHEMEIDGYGAFDSDIGKKKGGRVFNSWGDLWGKKGRCYMEWEDILRQGDVIVFFPPEGKQENIEPRRTLRKGMKGDDVKELQTKLTKHGFDCKADGKFGSGTLKKVKAFQTARKLDPDGVVGKLTWEELDKEPPAKPTSAHFTLDEFKCHDGTQVPPELYGNVQALMDALENIRKAFGNKPIKIVSGYRTLEYNRKIGNKTDGSQHIQGNAADIRISGVSPANVYKILDVMYPNQGLGKYSTFTHFDLRGKRARW